MRQHPSRRARWGWVRSALALAVLLALGACGPVDANDDVPDTGGGEGS